ncbi:MAG: PHP domain-containing protein [Cyanobacteria bacterium J069]|nr:MAG: PHP domain-containing protein [Cyanobacteria bacterium J069]
MLELHCHTTYSDGTLTPAALVQAAVESGVRALAITDHDTLAGWDEAIAAARPHNIEIIPGVELSTVWGDRSLHLLGFYPNPAQLTPLLQDHIAGRQRRAQQMRDKLAALGYAVTLPELGEGMAAGRLHLASALVKAGYVQTAQEAFERFLGDDGPAYVQYDKFLATDGVRRLRECGAVPVWAHPFLFRGGPIEATLTQLIHAGLMGVEVYHPSHTPNQVQQLEAWCDRHALLKTGGSDYHGPGESLEQPHRLNRLHLPLHLLTPLQQAARCLAGGTRQQGS